MREDSDREFDAPQSKQDVCEVIVKISNEDGSQKNTHKELCYELLTVSPQCIALKRIVEQAIGAFKGSPDDISVTIKYAW